MQGCEAVSDLNDSEWNELGLLAINLFQWLFSVHLPLTGVAGAIYIVD
jgi:hypothetical protein